MEQRQKNKLSAFLKARDIRQKTLKQLEECTSSMAFEVRVAIYNRKVQAGKFNINSTLNERCVTELRRLDRAITNFIRDQRARLRPPAEEDEVIPSALPPAEDDEVAPFALPPNQNDAPVVNDAPISALSLTESSSAASSPVATAHMSEDNANDKEALLNEVKKELAFLNAKLQLFDQIAKDARKSDDEKCARIYGEARNSVATIYKQISTWTERYSTGQLSLNQFKSNVAEVMDPDSSDIERLVQHRGFKEAFVNLLIIFGLPIVGWAIGAATIATGQWFFKLPTETGKILDNLNDAVNHIVEPLISW